MQTMHSGPPGPSPFAALAGRPIRLGMLNPLGAPPFASDPAPTFELIDLVPAECRTSRVDALVLGWQSSADRIAHEVRRQGYRGALIAALPCPSTSDVVTALSCGCDDAQSFPAEPRELVERIAAIRRRTEGHPAPPATIRAGRLEIGPDGRDPRVDGKPLKVSPNCSRVLAIVAASPHPVPLERIALALYGGDPPPSKTINTYLCLLRSIMSVATGEDGWLKLQDGGYVLYRR